MGMMSAYHPAAPAPGPGYQWVADEPEDLGRTAAAVALAQELAALLDMPVETTWWSLCNAPLEMIELLDTPQGWIAYAGYIANDLGHAAPDYTPEVH